ncbi:hypothetical protein K1719_013609 [Acacia pycnantha]|nr:hypothetical protein K1719_013609 [Acacia pycnantha]
MFKRFTHRTESSLDDLVPLVKHLVPKVHASYLETINLSEHQLVKLTLTDAGFVIQLFIMFHEWDDELDNDAKLSLPNSQQYIFEDLHLLENQLPFFVIEEMFDKAFPHDSHDSLPSFLELTCEYFGYFNRQKLKPNTNVKIEHFTDLPRFSYLQGKVSQ